MKNDVTYSTGQGSGAGYSILYECLQHSEQRLRHLLPPSCEAYTMNSCITVQRQGAREHSHIGCRQD